MGKKDMNIYALSVWEKALLTSTIPSIVSIIDYPSPLRLLPPPGLLPSPLLLERPKMENWKGNLSIFYDATNCRLGIQISLLHIARMWWIKSRHFSLIPFGVCRSDFFRASVSNHILYLRLRHKPQSPDDAQALSENFSSLITSWRHNNATAT